MAYSSNLLSLSFCFLVFFHGCLAQIDLVTNRRQGPQWQKPQQSFQNQCQLQNLNALEPKYRYKSEAGLTEFWDQNEEQFQCASVAFLRHKIYRKGLLLPSFTAAPQLIFVVSGQGIQGAVFPGCPETYQSQYYHQSKHSQRDQHQKIRQLKAGDVIAMPGGVAHWIYNNGQSQLVLVSLVDVGNMANQLDQNFRKFFLAGKPQQGLVTGGQSQSQSQSQRGQEEEQQESGGSNLFSAFDEQLLAEIFRIEPRLARKLQNPRDNKGAIVRVENEFEFARPQKRAEEEQRQRGSEGEEEEEEEEEEEGDDDDDRSEEGQDEREPRREKGEQSRPSRKEQGRKEGGARCNGLEETFCTMKIKHRTDASFADIFNPRAGRITTVNSFNLPILRFLRLSAERVVLYKNAIFAPHWNINAHSILYITRGRGRIQIVAENGNAIFDDHVKEGQVIVVPQNHAVLKKAGIQGFEYIAFKTNSNPMINQLAGRVSAFRAMPVDVLANSFGISREDARKLKENREEVTLFSPRQGSQQ